jgi:ribosomal protein L37AE/L43A
MLPPGRYKTLKGSRMYIHGGKSEVNFDWFEEENACIDCNPEAYDEEGYLVWNCEICGGGKAKLFKI